MAKCDWAKSGIYETYHDQEHGKMLEDDQALFERLVLEIMQPGLSFGIVLEKRTALKRAFANYNLAKLSQYGPEEIESLLTNEQIIRHRLKITAVIENAKLLLAITQQQTIKQWLFTLLDYRLEEADMVKQACKDLKKQGFKFIGPSVFSSLIASLGLITSHLPKCQLSVYNQEFQMALLTPFGYLKISYCNFQITSARYDYQVKEEYLPDDGFADFIKWQIDCYNQQKLEVFKLPLTYEATKFQRLVYDAVGQVKFGEYLTYKELGQRINSRGYQAIGSALRQTPFSLLIPAHRIGNKNQAGGFGENEAKKLEILSFEGVKNLNLP